MLSETVAAHILNSECFPPTFYGIEAPCACLYPWASDDVTWEPLGLTLRAFVRRTALRLTQKFLLLEVAATVAARHLLNHVWEISSILHASVIQLNDFEPDKFSDIYKA